RLTEAVGNPPTWTTGKSQAPVPLGAVVSMAMVAPIPADELPQPCGEVGLRSVAIVTTDIGDVGVRCMDVARLHRKHALLGFTAKQPFEQLDHVQQLLGMVVAQV